jgi:uncharacterized protein YprB with RNaseH-like and TPR domain
MLAIDTETTGVDKHHGAMPFFITTCDETGCDTPVEINQYFIFVNTNNKAIYKCTGLWNYKLGCIN